MRELSLKEIGSRIRAQRELLGYTREFLAEKLDVSAKFCSDIELGVKGMSLTTLMKISEILYINTDYILFGDTDKNQTHFQAYISLFNKCPEYQHSNLITIVKTFVDSTMIIENQKLK